MTFSHCTRCHDPIVKRPGGGVALVHFYKSTLAAESSHSRNVLAGSSTVSLSRSSSASPASMRESAEGDLFTGARDGGAE